MRRWVLLGLVAVAACGGGYALGGGYATTTPGYGYASAGVGVSGDFYSTLSPYGQWVQTSYGQAWQPSPSVVGYDFTPYATNGQWVNTDYGWAFASDYDWGWATFHYGNWWRDPGRGWMWFPGDTWGPAWVDWRYGNGWIGWAPLPPRFVDISIVSRPDYWLFCDTRSFVTPSVGRYVRRDPRIFHSTAPLATRVYRQGTTYNYGPSVTQVEAVAGRPIPRVRVQAPPPRQIRQVNVRGELQRVRGVEERPMPAPQQQVVPAQPQQRYVPPGQQQRYVPPGQQRVVPAQPQQRYVPPGQQQRYYAPPAQPQQRYAPPAPAPQQRDAPPAQSAPGHSLNAPAQQMAPSRVPPHTAPPARGGPPRALPPQAHGKPATTHRPAPPPDDQPQDPPAKAPERRD